MAEESAREWTLATLHHHLSTAMEARATAEDAAIAVAMAHVEQRLRDLYERLTVRTTTLSREADGANAALERLLMEKSAALRELIDARFAATSEALTKAEVATDKRFDAVNEFRKTLAEQAAQFAMASTVNAKFDTMGEQVKQLQLHGIESERLIDARIAQAMAASEKGIGLNADRVSNVEGKVYIGGAGVVVLLTVMQIAINLFHAVPR